MPMHRQQALSWLTETALGPSACLGNRVFQALPNPLLRQIEASLGADYDLRHHSNRLGGLSHLMGRLAGKTDSGWLARLAEAAVLHDIGKIKLNPDILGKQGGLTHDERTHMRLHGPLGADMLKSFGGTHFHLAALVARHHHETYDGSGYPDGLAGETLPQEARIVALCDVYDALRTRRAYKPGYDHAQTMMIMTQGDGRTKPEHFDPYLLDLFIRHSADVETLYEAD